MPIDTAVAATAKETASATVANSSTPARRRLANDFSKPGETKPIFPESEVMIVILIAASSPNAARGESVFALLEDSRWNPAPGRRNYGEAFEE
jgi:hypothetical protein